MNKENLQLLIDTIKDQPHTSYDANEGFNMTRFFHMCNTPSCIAGFAAELSGNKHSNIAKDVAEAWLELSNREAECLFYVQRYDGVNLIEIYHESYSSLSSITPQEAVKALQNLMNGVDKDHIWDHLRLKWREYMVSMFDLGN